MASKNHFKSIGVKAPPNASEERSRPTLRIGKFVSLAVVIWCMCLAMIPYTEGAVPDLATVDTEVVANPTARQQAWLRATPQERIGLAEALGESGARKFADAKGWTAIVDGTNSTLAQGFDQVYRSADGVIHVVEAKGGTSQLGKAYGYLQNSPEWAMTASGRTLKSASASGAEKEAARAILKALPGRLEVNVIRTEHVLGEPTAVVLEYSALLTDKAARLGKWIIRDLAKQGIRVLDDVAKTGDGFRGAVRGLADDAVRKTDSLCPAAAAAEEATGTTLRAIRTTSKAVIPLAIAIDIGLRAHTVAKIEDQFAAGEITERQRETAHAKNAGGMAGGWTGAYVCAKVGATGGAAVGSLIAPGPGTMIGAGVGGITGGALGYLGGEKAGEAAAAWAVTDLHDSGKTVVRVANNAWTETKQGAQNIGRITARTTVATWKGSKATATAAGHSYCQGWEWMSSNVNNVWNRITHD